MVKGELLLLLLSIATCCHKVMKGSCGHCCLLLWSNEGKGESWGDEGELSLSHMQF